MDESLSLRITSPWSTIGRSISTSSPSLHRHPRPLLIRGFFQRNTERRLPDLPIRPNHPSSATSTLLPLRPANKFTPEVLSCGGSTLDSDSLQYWQLSTQGPASKICARMVLSESGIAGGWKLEDMPTARIMGDAVRHSLYLLALLSSSYGAGRRTDD